MWEQAQEIPHGLIAVTLVVFTIGLIEIPVPRQENRQARVKSWLFNWASPVILDKWKRELPLFHF